MCLAIPGQLMNITHEDPLLRRGQVNFGGVLKEVSLAYVPDVEVGQYVIVHVGFALSIIDEAEAEETLNYLAHLTPTATIPAN